MGKWSWFVAVILCSLSAFSQGKVKCVVLGYSAVWRDGVNPPAEYNLDGITYVARSFLQPLPEGSVRIPSGYFNPDLSKAAHQHGVKLLMSIGGGGARSADWIAIATHPQSLQRFISKVKQLSADNLYDGVDIDWEPSDPNKAEWQDYVILLKAMRAQMPDKVISTALPTDEYSTRLLSWQAVIANVNFINAMAYDYSGPWSGIAGHATNLFPAGDYSGEPGHSVQEGMQNLIEHHRVPPEKILLGMNFFAYRFRVNHVGDKFPRNAEGVSDDLTYQQVLNLKATGQYQTLWDQKAASPYLQRTSGGSVVCYDDPESVRRKVEYCQSLNCAGVMIWGFGSDMSGEQTPLLSAAIQSCGGEKQTLLGSRLETEIADMSSLIDQHVGQGNGPSAPQANIKSLSVEQLTSRLAELQFREGVSNDIAWKRQTVDP